MHNKHNADFGAQKQTRGCMFRIISKLTAIGRYVWMFTNVSAIFSWYEESKLEKLIIIKIIPDVYVSLYIYFDT